MNVGEWIQQVSDSLQSSGLFYGHGTDNALDEAAWLVLHTIGAAVNESFEDFDQELNEQQGKRVQELLKIRIEKRMPMAYLLGSAWFAGLEFKVNESVLIPRSPIGELIVEAFAPWLHECAHDSALDMCAGCGCIAIAMAIHMEWKLIDAVDISRSALEVALENVKQHNVGERVNLIQSDLFSELAGKSYNLIVSNPPYVSRPAMKRLPDEYQVEPEMALLSGEDGLDACLQILLQSPDHMTENGLLVCEVGESEQVLCDLLPTLPFLWLDFENGGSGVFLLSRNELMMSKPSIQRVLEDREHVA